MNAPAAIESVTIDTRVSSSKNGINARTWDYIIDAIRLRMQDYADKHGFKTDGIGNERTDMENGSLMMRSGIITVLEMFSKGQVMMDFSSSPELTKMGLTGRVIFREFVANESAFIVIKDDANKIDHAIYLPSLVLACLTETKEQT